MATYFHGIYGFILSDAQTETLIIPHGHTAEFRGKELSIGTWISRDPPFVMLASPHWFPSAVYI